jgi:hypothetical protein
MSKLAVNSGTSGRKEIGPELSYVDLDAKTARNLSDVTVSYARSLAGTLMSLPR